MASFLVPLLFVPLRALLVNKQEITNCLTDISGLHGVSFSLFYFNWFPIFLNEILHNLGCGLSWNIEISDDIGPTFQHDRLEMNSCCLFAHSPTSCALCFIFSLVPIWATHYDAYLNASKHLNLWLRPRPFHPSHTDSHGFWLTLGK